MSLGNPARRSDWFFARGFSHGQNGAQGLSPHAARRFPTVTGPDVSELSIQLVKFGRPTVGVNSAQSLALGRPNAQSLSSLCCLSSLLAFPSAALPPTPRMKSRPPRFPNSREPLPQVLDLAF